MTRFAILLSIVAAAGSVAYGMIDHGWLSRGILVLAIGIVWLFVYLRKMNHFSGWVFVLFGVMPALAVWMDVERLLALAGMIFALIAWDLIDFEVRLKATQHRDDARQIELAHFARLGIIIALSLLAVIIAGFVRVSLTLGSALIFVLLGIWGISTLVYRLRSRE